MEENLKNMFKIIRGQCTESLIANIVEDKKYEAIKHDQDVIGILKLIKGVVFKSDINKELIHAIWGAYMTVFR